MPYLCSLSEVCVSKYWKQELKSFDTCTQTYIGTFFLKARQIMDPQNKDKKKPLRLLYTGLQS